MNPYIGIVDFTTRKQVEEMLAVFHRHRGRNAEKVLHVDGHGNLALESSI